MDTVRTKEQSLCPVCGSSGTLAYETLTDKLFDVPGTWSMRSCSNTQCKSYWLDPQPFTEDIGKLYTAYTTHSDDPPAAATSSGGLRKILKSLRNAYLHERFGYPTNLPGYLSFILSKLSLPLPTWRDSVGVQVLYTPYVQGGSLLDVGCGGGHNMVAMEKLGWKVTGVDFDEPAVENARRKGLTVYVGDPASQQFPEDGFDAIIMNHVIEHVPDPVAFLRECNRILKPGGTLTAFTPNARSRGHMRFRKNWRGLEVPRHLQIFTPEALALAATKAGFTHVTGTTSIQGVLYIYDASKALEETGSFEIPPETRGKHLQNKVRWYAAGWKHALFPGTEEVAVLRCTK